LQHRFLDRGKIGFGVNHEVSFSARSMRQQLRPGDRIGAGARFDVMLRGLVEQR
jgi:hypothetical protein